MLLIREDLPVKVLSVDKGNEDCYVEVILNKNKMVNKLLIHPQWK